MMRLVIGIMWAWLSYAAPLMAAANAVEAKPMPRTILALYTSSANADLAETNPHTMAEMPLNHLGLVVKYHDIEQGLPDVEAMRDELRGVLLWFDPASRVPDAKAYLALIDRIADLEIPIVSFGHSFLFEDRKGFQPDLAAVNEVFGRFGVEFKERWVTVTYDMQVEHIRRDYLNFERDYPPVLKSYQAVEVTHPEANILLAVKTTGLEEKGSHLAFITPKFGYIAEGYEVFSSVDEDKDGDERARFYRQWYANPFRFFRDIYQSDALPKPDSTTQAGLRIFYQHIDGDGWNNLSDVSPYRQSESLSAEVIHKELISKYPDLPFTVGAIAADLDPEWVGRESSHQAARAIYALPNVEASSHTYSHPFYWDFFAKYDPEIEKGYFDHYTYGHWGQGLVEKLLQRSQADSARPQCMHGLPQSSAEVPGADAIPGQYYTPRAYANKPFDLQEEICGASAYIQKFMPEGKTIKLVQWSGNVRPFEQAIAMTRIHHYWNLNGGDTRFDPEYPSYAWVAPVGRVVGNERQIYSSSSNENTYTGDWTQRFYGYKYLPRTILNTESPIRIKPFNIYYHMYSGQKLASLNAVRANLDLARGANLHPIWASDYAAIANGFYTAQLVALGDARWEVRDRGALQTIRFDYAIDKTIDYEASLGVIGHRYLGGALYVYLDEAVDKPVIQLKQLDFLSKNLHISRSYLIESRWKVWEVHENETKITFYATGFGDGTMLWRVPDGKEVRVEVEGAVIKNQELDNGIFTLLLQSNAETHARVTFSYD